MATKPPTSVDIHAAMNPSVVSWYRKGSKMSKVSFPVRRLRNFGTRVFAKMVSFKQKNS